MTDPTPAPHASCAAAPSSGGTGSGNRWLRLLRHFVYDERRAQRFIDDQAQARLAERVARSEALHSGEIRLCIEGALPLAEVWRGTDTRTRAVAAFSQLGVWDTEHNNGVLIYVLLAERRIEIVADRGLASRVAPAQWQKIADQLGQALRAQRYEEGLSAAVDAVHALLLEHFPLAPGQRNPNELPDRPVMR